MVLLLFCRQGRRALEGFSYLESGTGGVVKHDAGRRARCCELRRLFRKGTSSAC